MAKSVDWNWETCLTNPQVAALKLLRSKLDRLEARRVDIETQIAQLESREAAIIGAAKSEARRRGLRKPAFVLPPVTADLL